MNGAASMPLSRSRVASEWRAFVGLWWWPLMVAVLPYRAGIAFARFVSARLPLYDDAARAAAKAWREVEPDGDERAFLAAWRFGKLIDHADLFWALTRSDAFLLSRLSPPPAPAVPPGPLLVVSFHYGQGLWLMRWLRECGAPPRFLSVPSVREGADSTLMFLYGRLRIRVVERLAGAAPIFVGGARRAIRDALASGETVYGLVDVPVRGAASEPGNCAMFGQQLLLPTGILDSAQGADVPACVLTARVVGGGRRSIELALVPHAGALTISALAGALEQRLRNDAAAWHLWNLWRAFRAREPADR